MATSLTENVIKAVDCDGCGTPAGACSWIQNPAAGRGDCCHRCEHSAARAARCLRCGQALVGASSAENAFKDVYICIHCTQIISHAEALRLIANEGQDLRREELLAHYATKPVNTYHQYDMFDASDGGDSIVVPDEDGDSMFFGIVDELRSSPVAVRVQIEKGFNADAAVRMLRKIAEQIERHGLHDRSEDCPF